MDKIRVLIADDHLIMREGLRSILGGNTDIEIVGEAPDGEEAVKKTKDLKPDVVLMDITMPGISGLEATRLIKEALPDVSVLALTMHESDEYVFNMLSAGASGYFIKGGSSEELIGAIRAVSRGEVFLYPTMLKKLLGDYLQLAKTGEVKETYDVLTSREREVLKLIAEGHTTQEIAELLFLSPATVQTHRAHIISKLGLRSRSELIKYAIRQGYISLDS